MSNIQDIEANVDVAMGLLHDLALRREKITQQLAEMVDREYGHLVGREFTFTNIRYRSHATKPRRVVSVGYALEGAAAQRQLFMINLRCAVLNKQGLPILNSVDVLRRSPRDISEIFSKDGDIVIDLKGEYQWLTG